MILHITLNSVLLPVKRRTSPGGHHYNVCLLCSLSLLTAFLPITAKQKWKTCWLWVMTVLYLMVRMGTVQLSDNFRPMHWELTISVECTIHCKIFQNLPCTNAHGSFQSLGHAVFSNDMPLLQPTWDHCHTTEDEFDSWCSQSPTKHHEDSRQVLYLSQPPVDKQNYLT